jgi:hypothetical protein
MAGNGLSLEKEQLDPERLKRITEYFARIQGLYMVAGGCVMVTAQVSNFFWKDTGMTIGLLLSGPLAFFAVIIWIPRYYTRRFGLFRQVPGPNPKPWKYWKRRQLVVVIVTLLTLSFGIHEIERLTHPPVDVAGFVFLLLFPWLQLADGWSDLRSTLGIVLVTTSAMVLAVLHLLPLWVTFQDRQLVYWKLLTLTSLWILFILMGICDHLSLTQLLPREKAEDNHA